MDFNLYIHNSCWFHLDSACLKVNSVKKAELPKDKNVCTKDLHPSCCTKIWKHYGSESVLAVKELEAALFYVSAQSFKAPIIAPD